jgi:uncharacterized protein YbjQ (UPF0145 family)
MPRRDRTVSEKKGFDKFIMVTTPILDGVEVQEYLAPVVVRNVRAVNVIRDFFTTFRDIFGGRSGAYEEVIADMYREVMSDMRTQAEQMGATAVVGLRMDFESIGAKRKSLVMATGQGTAVRV